MIRRPPRSPLFPSAPPFRPPAPSTAAPPSVRAPAAILVEPATGDVVFQRNARDRRPVASATKLMTALLTLERDRKSTRLNSSHANISYAVFCLKKKQAASRC